MQVSENVKKNKTFKELEPASCVLPSRSATLDMHYARHQHFCSVKSARHGQFQEKEKTLLAN